MRYLTGIFFFVCRNFCVRRDFISSPKTLKKRLMIVGLAMLLLSPFLVIFMLVYLFLRHAEQFYNHPTTASSRRWSNLSKWMFREFNEVPQHIIPLLLSYSVCTILHLCLAYAKNFLILESLAYMLLLWSTRKSSFDLCIHFCHAGWPFVQAPYQ